MAKAPALAVGADGKPYQLKISRLTIDKLGVKLYDKASAVVAELIANGYDADAETVTVSIPLSVQLASKAGGHLQDKGYVIEVEDDGHGMTPAEAREFYLRVGTDRRQRPEGKISRKKKRPVMGRKGIGKLAPFGICRHIEVWSAGGKKVASKGFVVTHFHMDFDEIVADEDTDVVLQPGEDDGKFSAKSGTKIRLSSFLAKRVPDKDTFLRQLAVRFTFARPDFQIRVIDTQDSAKKVLRVKHLDIPLMAGTKVDLADRPAVTPDGETLPMSGWLGMAKEAYKNEEMMGVRIYARGKIVGVTRDFNQPAGFTGEFAMRSYLVGEVVAEWLDLDDGEDLIRTDRQDILWDSDYGQILRTWGAELIKEIARKAKEPRRVRVRDLFIEKSDIEKRAMARFGNQKDVAKVAVDLAKKFGGFAAEDELDDEDYLNDLGEFILSVAPHHALIEAFQEFSNEVTKGEASLEDLVDIFDKTQVAELASYAQIAMERVRVIGQLEEVIDGDNKESAFQDLIAKAPWLIKPNWTVITQNEGLRTFRDRFQQWMKKEKKTDVVLAIGHEDKRPDFTLVSIDGFLHIVELKKAGHDFDDKDFERLHNYVEAFEEFFDKHDAIARAFPEGWRIDLIADGENIKQAVNRTAYRSLKQSGRVRRVPWNDMLYEAKKVHEQFLEAREKSAKRRAGKN
ncbi:MAG: ATP-binding protein [Rhodospirillales bacterium]|nr:ATP-binding protein [Rhodospirillales bacterium]